MDFIQTVLYTLNNLISCRRCVNGGIDARRLFHPNNAKQIANNQIIESIQSAVNNAKETFVMKAKNRMEKKVEKKSATAVTTTNNINQINKLINFFLSTINRLNFWG